MHSFEPIEKNILYEDNHLLIVKKECGILSQPGSPGKLDLFSLCRDYIRIKYNKPGNVYLGLIHRLDRYVSGITVFAKTSKSAGRMAEIFKGRKIKKYYTAVSEGFLQPEESTLIDFLKKDPEKKTAYESADGLKSELFYRTLRRGKISGSDVSLLEIELFTGRFHQIRFQLSKRGSPVLGDTLYGSGCKTDEEPCIFLHASKLTFEHPVKKIPLIIECPYPSKWDSYFQD
ncbi:MAG: RluA family pseudouridine synthase [Spirochaetia bacterium]|nr:RluA family pseudouridine synthase [Spirochaetia bacterium]